MHRNARIVATVAIAATLIPNVSVICAYAYFKAEAVAETQRQELPAFFANSIKHAFAAGETYALLRDVGVPRGPASYAVYRLGQLNEYAEFYGRPVRKRDPTREIYKDLWNNASGVLAADWVDRQGLSGSKNRLKAIGLMSARDTLLGTFMDSRIPERVSGKRPETSDLQQALKAFRQDRSPVYGIIERALPPIRVRDRPGSQAFA
ncbi:MULTISPECIES: hypothetical protein [unclassified Bosea (in: a-proteobacteria)]|uniref:hypothetical protein n=1 Tax=unclassified Bosea (in: a-proteobacteria) TaxID=2653178 RepID=UPI000F76133A|nr:MULTISPECIES: hypothetical protein [unclassified Bosea (in: a-proteobacteria)]AZO80077.1 hypothetical protein BLM15_22660 [Bosea sp. Tri-49]RXT22863.1 hypothetical protein B5U98_09450 [Bosea sp. Tri-39]RXT38332.1 hypothetical protein B5U99_08900 [Bosea sp. Tri-54]